MAWPLVRMTDQYLNKLYRTIFILDCVSLVIVLGCFIEAIQFSYTTGYYIKMVSVTDGLILPLLISLVALLALPVHVGGIYLSYQIDAERVSVRAMHWLSYFVIATLLIVVCLLCVIITSIVHTRSLQNGIHNGISATMKLYNADKDASQNMDYLQVLFQCCGSKSYKEWFFLRWDCTMPEQLTPGTAVSDDVPFSCCLQKSLRPCVHNHVSTASHVYRYDPPLHMTISEVGCLQALIAEATRMATKASLWLTLFLLLEIIMLLLKRLQYTSLLGKTYSRTYGTTLREAWLVGSASATMYAKGEETDEESQALVHDDPYSTPSKSTTTNTQ